MCEATINIKNMHLRITCLLQNECWVIGPGIMAWDVQNEMSSNENCATLFSLEHIRYEWNITFTQIRWVWFDEVMTVISHTVNESSLIEITLHKDGAQSHQRRPRFVWMKGSQGFVAAFPRGIVWRSHANNMLERACAAVSWGNALQSLWCYERPNLTWKRAVKTFRLWLWAKQNG